MHAVLNNDLWRIKRMAPSATRRGAATPIPPQFLAAGVTIAEVLEATPTADPRESGDVPVVDVSVQTDPGTACVLAVRHPSGALTFHFGEAEIASGPAKGRRRSATATGPTFRFQ